MDRRKSSLLVARAAALATLAACAAEVPTDQNEAIRSDCRDDFLKHCEGVEPGRKEALQWLVNHLAEVSGACQGALGPVEQETGIEPSTGSGG